MTCGRLLQIFSPNPKEAELTWPRDSRVSGKHGRAGQVSEQATTPAANRRRPMSSSAYHSANFAVSYQDTKHSIEKTIKKEKKRDDLGARDATRSVQEGGWQWVCSTETAKTDRHHHHSTRRAHGAVASSSDQSQFLFSFPLSSLERKREQFRRQHAPGQTRVHQQ